MARRIAELEEERKGKADRVDELSNMCDFLGQARYEVKPVVSTTTFTHCLTVHGTTGSSNFDDVPDEVPSHLSSPVVCQDVYHRPALEVCS